MCLTQHQWWYCTCVLPSISDGTEHVSYPASVVVLCLTQHQWWYCVLPSISGGTVSYPASVVVLCLTQHQWWYCACVLPSISGGTCVLPSISDGTAQLVAATLVTLWPREGRVLVHSHYLTCHHHHHHQSTCCGHTGKRKLEIFNEVTQEGNGGNQLCLAVVV